MSLVTRPIKKKAIMVIGLMAFGSSGLLAGEDAASCDLNPGEIKSSPETGIILRELKTAANNRDLSFTLRNLRGLNKKLPFTECKITGETEACKVFTADAISFVSQGKNFSAKIFWENPNKTTPTNLKLKISSESTICSYDILVGGNPAKSDNVKCISTPRCSSSGSWF